MKTCKNCGSGRLVPYEYKPPINGKGNHTCDKTCDIKGTMCLACRLVW